MARASGDVDLEFFAGFFAAIGAAERCDIADARRRLEGLAGPGHGVAELLLRVPDRASAHLARSCSPGDPACRPRSTRWPSGTPTPTPTPAGRGRCRPVAWPFRPGPSATFVPTLRTMIEESDVAPNWKPPFGLALLARGDRAAAAEVLDAFEEPLLDFFWLTTMQSRAELAVGLERRDVVRRLFDVLLPYRDQLGIIASGSLVPRAGGHHARPARARPR